MPTNTSSCCGASSGRKRLLLIGGGAAVAIVAASAWQWSWLVAVGVIPVLLSFAPCLLMCGLGLCMMGRGSSTKAAASGAGTDAAIPASAPLRAVGHEPGATSPSQPLSAPEHAALT
jgi:hypothetical protein